MQISVGNGDITGVPAGGLITAINSGGMWFGGIDEDDQRSAGNVFHGQAAARMPLTDGDVIYASTSTPHRGLFQSVIFVVDDQKRPLREVVLAGLREAEKRQLGSVSLPALRTGVMAGIYERTTEAALDETVAALKSFNTSKPQHVRMAQIVVFNDTSINFYLTQALQP